MWMRHQDGGLAALLYGPCTVSTTIGNVRVHVEEKTQYPFEHEVRIDIQPEREVEFPLYLRDPDGNGVELYWDRPHEQWPRNSEGGLNMFTRALDLDGLLKEAKT